MTDPGRIVVIGAGHNGLVCAALLARAGRQVLVVEAADEVGGGARTREFARGFRVPAVAHLLYQLGPSLARELALGEHGLALVRTRLKTVALAPGAQALVLDGGEVVSGEVSAEDRAALRAHVARMRRFGAFLGRWHDRPPPRLAWNGWREALPAARLALDVRRLGRDDMREFLRIAASNVQDLLDESLSNQRLKGALALDAVLGMHAGPRSGNTVLAALHRQSVAMDGTPGALALPRGGMGAVTQALAAAARREGAEIRLASRVEAISVQGGRASGVRLANGEDVAAALVVSNADPKTTLLGLLGARHLEAGFARRIANLRRSGAAAKLHLALAGAPRFDGVAAEHLGERLVIAPDPDYVERAFNHAKYREHSTEPVFEITVPSMHDPSLAPDGGHVLSAIVQYAPYDLAGGWEAGRERFLDLALNVVERYAPGLRAQVVAAELLAPPDIERAFGMGGGHWHHGELALDQYLSLRPVPGAAHYATPVEGLWLCGAGCHPGGGVMGSAGANAARAILAGGAGR